MAQEDGGRAQGTDARHATKASLRRDNLERLLRFVHERGPTSRAVLTEELGLARNTVALLVAALVDSGLIVERPPDPVGLRGRPSPVVEAAPTRATVLAVELAANSVRLASVGLGGEVLGRREWALDADRSADVIVPALIQRLRTLGRDRRRTGTVFQAVGVACWGIVRSGDGFVHAAPNIGWRDVPLGAVLRDGLAPRSGSRALFQSIAVANDADLGALAEFRRGSGIGASRLLYVHGNIGVGGGIIDGGRQLAAKGGYVGEIGHMSVNPRGQRCRCGATGCWETEVDERALLRAVGVTDAMSSQRQRQAVAEVLTDAAGGARQATAAVKQVARSLGSGLASMVNILGPDRVVLGGYLADLLSLATAEIRQPLRERAFSPEAREVVVCPGALGEDAALLGASEEAFEALLADPLGSLDH